MSHLLSCSGQLKIDNYHQELDTKCSVNDKAPFALFTTGRNDRHQHHQCDRAMPPFSPMPATKKADLIESGHQRTVITGSHTNYLHFQPESETRFDQAKLHLPYHRHKTDLDLNLKQRWPCVIYSWIFDKHWGFPIKSRNPSSFLFHKLFLLRNSAFLFKGWVALSSIVCSFVIWDISSYLHYMMF